jgi:ATP-dependent Clp protease ATP-binding subunit ClpA
MADEKIFHLLARANIACVIVATPSAYRKPAQNQLWLEQHLQPVPVLPASEQDAIKVLAGIKGRYEDFTASRTQRMR